MVLGSHGPDYTRYESLYKYMHANAELSWQEHETAATIARSLEDLSPDLELHTGIAGAGLVAIFRTGPGKTILLRADLDGLPVEEKTGLDYACRKRMTDQFGVDQPVMHACGHDMHLTALVGAADVLLTCRQAWSGTIIFLFQPAEEKATGAKDMVEAGLLTKYCPVPDVLLAQHVYWGKAGCHADRLRWNADHGLWARRPWQLQTIVSREVPPGELAVVTVGALNAGSAENIISDHAVLKVNTRSVAPQWRDHIVGAIKRIVRAECQASNSPKEPTFEMTVTVPATINDQAIAQHVGKAFSSHFGTLYDANMSLVPASEDFSYLAQPINRPYVFWFIGGHDPEDWDKKRQLNQLDQLPSNHSPYFAPAVQPTLKTGVEALVIAVLALLKTSD
ncbi:putative Hippurate hydrolase [Seiridium unicorne]|uniref:Hippurate hydrolase n=1 Tax=Seiridium unicorne TaxID=138068 RepID=A0ABR2US42_9PEZI